MKRSHIVLVLALVLALAACGGDSTDTTAPAATTPDTSVETTAPDTAPETTAADTTAPPEAAADLLVWTDAERGPVVEEIAPAFTEATGVDVTVEILEFGQIRDQVGVAGPAGEGPDLFIGAHDWVGQLAIDGSIDPIDLGSAADDFVEVALNAFTFEGDLYAVPYATEAVALYYNTELVPEPPASWDEIVSTCEALPDIDNCVGLPGGGDAADAYHHQPFLSAFGGGIFAYDPDTGFDPNTVELDSEATIQGANFLADQVDAGIVQSVNYDNAKQLFLDGAQPYWITGPWEVGNLADVDVQWEVVPIPTIDGSNPPAPHVGAQGFFLSSFSEDKVVAQSFLLDFIATEEGMQALYEADPRIPAYEAVLEGVADDPTVQAFSEAVANGIPMPNIPQMSAVWDPLGSNLLLIRNGEMDGTEGMASAAQAVRAAVEG